MIEQRYYDIVALELQDQYLEPGLWTRAMAEAGGENDEARLLYVQLRIGSLMRLERCEAERRAFYLIPIVIGLLLLIWIWRPARIALMFSMGIWAFMMSLFLMAMVPCAVCQALLQAFKKHGRQAACPQSSPS
jgi:hypothetical protein